MTQVRSSLCVLWLLVGLLLSAAGCRPRDESAADGSLSDAPLGSYQHELLEIAFEAASAMPIDPHIKNRSRAQELVVTTCLKLEQPQRALRYIEQIENWRRGTGYADLAFYYARRDLADQVEPYVKRAAQVAGGAEDWRRDRIRTKIAQVHSYLGQTSTASESGETAQTQAMICSPEEFDEKVETLDTLVASGDFDLVKNALAAYAELFNRFYGDIQRRRLVEEKIKTAWSDMPVFIRIDLLAELAGFSLAHDDPRQALELVNEAGASIDSARWQPRSVIPLMARLAELRFRAGDEEKARGEAAEALALFDAEREVIVNIYRAELLRSIAEAIHEMGDTADALDLYARALEAGIENPNSRPRAEDLAATCCSMALHAAEPTPQLLSRIREIRDGFGDPW